MTIEFEARVDVGLAERPEHVRQNIDDLEAMVADVLSAQDLDLEKLDRLTDALLTLSLDIEDNSRRWVRGSVDPFDNAWAKWAASARRSPRAATRPVSHWLGPICDEDRFEPITVALDPGTLATAGTPSI